MKVGIYSGFAGLIFLSAIGPVQASDSSAWSNNTVSSAIEIGVKANFGQKLKPGFPQAEINPAIAADNGVYGWQDVTVEATDSDNSEAGTYEGEWTGSYIDEEQRVYQGQWDGTYTGEDGRVYQGTYRGTLTGDPVSNAPRSNTGDRRPSAAPRSNTGDRTPVRGIQYSNTGDRTPVRGQYSNTGDRSYSDDYVPFGYERYEQCLRGRGLTGGAIGAILGGIAGNRIAGRGDRLVGTLIGGGIGALAGVGIEKAVNKCRKYLPRQITQPAYYPQYGYGWQGGYYYQPQAPVVTTITVIPGTVTTTTVTTEEVIYETVAARPHRGKGKGLKRPAPTRKRCSC